MLGSEQKKLNKQDQVLSSFYTSEYVNLDAILKRPHWAESVFYLPSKLTLDQLHRTHLKAENAHYLYFYIPGPTQLGLAFANFNLSLPGLQKQRALSGGRRGRAHACILLRYDFWFKMWFSVGYTLASQQEIMFLERKIQEVNLKKSSTTATTLDTKKVAVTPLKVVKQTREFLPLSQVSPMAPLSNLLIMLEKNLANNLSKSCPDSVALKLQPQDGKTKESQEIETERSLALAKLNSSLSDIFSKWRGEILERDNILKRWIDGQRNVFEKDQADYKVWGLNWLPQVAFVEVLSDVDGYDIITKLFTEVKVHGNNFQNIIGVFCVGETVDQTGSLPKWYVPPPPATEYQAQEEEVRLPGWIHTISPAFSIFQLDGLAHVEKFFFREPFSRMLNRYVQQQEEKDKDTPVEKVRMLICFSTKDRLRSLPLAMLLACGLAIRTVKLKEIQCKSQSKHKAVTAQEYYREQQQLELERKEYQLLPLWILSNLEMNGTWEPNYFKCLWDLCITNVEQQQQQKQSQGETSKERRVVVEALRSRSYTMRSKKTTLPPPSPLFAVTESEEPEGEEDNSGGVTSGGPRPTLAEPDTVTPVSLIDIYQIYIEPLIEPTTKRGGQEEQEEEDGGDFSETDFIDIEESKTTKSEVLGGVSRGGGAGGAGGDSGSSIWWWTTHPRISQKQLSALEFALRCMLSSRDILNYKIGVYRQMLKELSAMASESLGEISALEKPFKEKGVNTTPLLSQDCSHDHYSTYLGFQSLVAIIPSVIANLSKNAKPLSKSATELSATSLKHLIKVFSKGEEEEQEAAAEASEYSTISHQTITNFHHYQKRLISIFKHPRYGLLGVKNRIGNAELGTLLAQVVLSFSHNALHMFRIPYNIELAIANIKERDVRRNAVETIQHVLWNLGLVNLRPAQVLYPPRSKKEAKTKEAYSWSDLTDFDIKDAEERRWLPQDAKTVCDYSWWTKLERVVVLNRFPPSPKLLRLMSLMQGLNYFILLTKTSSTEEDTQLQIKTFFPYRIVLSGKPNWLLGDAVDLFFDYLEDFNILPKIEKKDLEEAVAVELAKLHSGTTDISFSKVKIYVKQLAERYIRKALMNSTSLWSQLTPSQKSEFLKDE